MLVPLGADVSDAMSGVPELAVYINADPDSVTLTLLGGNKATFPGAECDDAGTGAQISYSTICTFRPSTRLPLGAYTLRLAITESFKPVTTNFALRIEE